MKKFFKLVSLAAVLFLVVFNLPSEANADHNNAKNEFSEEITFTIVETAEELDDSTNTEDKETGSKKTGAKDTTSNKRTNKLLPKMGEEVSYYALLGIIVLAMLSFFIGKKVRGNNNE